MTSSRAKWACCDKQTGRVHPESHGKARNAFQHDRDRIIHSRSFRRLKHKTQVFVAPEGDHFRTRLTHSLEVSQIARTLARYFALHEDLTETVALAHDLGHPPFGHKGEETLNAVMKPLGGFDHNLQSLRIVMLLEQSYPTFDGLNLCHTTLESMAKHNGPLEKNSPVLELFPEPEIIFPTLYPPLEAQLVTISDDIAYNHHDLEDGLRANAFQLEELCEALPHIGFLHKQIIDEWPELEGERRARVLIREAIGETVRDVIKQTEKNLHALKPETLADIRAAGRVVADFSPAMTEKQAQLKKFLQKNLYQDEKVIRETDRGKEFIGTIFSLLIENPQRLPEGWKKRLEKKSPAATERLIADYIAGMTDRFAGEEYERLTERLATTP